MRLRLMLGLVLLLIIVAGCANTTSTIFKSYKPHPEDYPIEVVSGFPEDREYEAVAMIDTFFIDIANTIVIQFYIGWFGG